MNVDGLDRAEGETRSPDSLPLAFPTIPLRWGQ